MQNRVASSVSAGSGIRARVAQPRAVRDSRASRIRRSERARFARTTAAVNARCASS